MWQRWLWYDLSIFSSLTKCKKTRLLFVKFSLIGKVSEKNTKPNSRPDKITRPKSTTNPVKHLRWSFLRKQLNLKAVNYSCKKLHLRCVIGIWICQLGLSYVCYYGELLVARSWNVHLNMLHWTKNEVFH